MTTAIVEPAVRGAGRSADLWPQGRLEPRRDVAEAPRYPIGVDVVGLGWGVCGLLRARGVRVIEIAGNAPSTVDPKTYANLRAEGYGELGRRLDMAGRSGYPEAEDGETEQQRRRRRRGAAPLVFLVPPDEKLHEELRAVDKIFGTDGKKYAVTPKRKTPGMKPGTITIQEQIGRSPDRSDSLMYFHRALQSPAISLEEALEAGFF